MNGELLLNFNNKNGRTILSSVKQSMPFRVYSPIYEQNILKLTIMNVTPGMLAGDKNSVKIICKDDTNILIKDQGSTKIFDTNGDFCTQNIDVKVGKNAVFKYLPHSIIPFKNSNFVANNTINLQKSSKLAFAEIIASGRIAMNEQFEFLKLHSKTKVFLEDKLIYFSNEYLTPSMFDYRKIGAWQGFSHIGTCFLYNENNDYQKFIDILKDMENVAYSHSKTGFLIRFVAQTGQEIITKLEKIMLKMEEI